MYRESMENMQTDVREQNTYKIITVVLRELIKRGRVTWDGLTPHSGGVAIFLDAYAKYE